MFAALEELNRWRHAAGRAAHGSDRPLGLLSLLSALALAFVPVRLASRPRPPPRRAVP